MCAFVLVAEDDVKQAELLRRYLRHEAHSVLVVHNGQEAVDQARLRQPDLLVLDVMMPRLDGFDVMRALRQDSEVAVLVVTARSTAEDKLAGFDLGADDYLTKPYDPRELMARVRSLLRRARPAGHRPVLPLCVGDLVLDQVRHTVRMHGHPIDCTPAEFRILEALLAEPGRVLSRRQLLNQAHGDEAFVTERTADTHLKNLRRKIEADPRQPAYLHTVYGVGYKIAYSG